MLSIIKILESSRDALRCMKIRSCCADARSNRAMGNGRYQPVFLKTESLSHRAPCEKPWKRPTPAFRSIRFIRFSACRTFLRCMCFIKQGSWILIFSPASKVLRQNSSQKPISPGLNSHLRPSRKPLSISFQINVKAFSSLEKPPSTHGQTRLSATRPQLI